MCGREGVGSCGGWRMRDPGEEASRQATCDNGKLAIK